MEINLAHELSKSHNKAQGNSVSPFSSNQNVWLPIIFLKYFRPLGMSSDYIEFWVLYLYVHIYEEWEFTEYESDGWFMYSI
jgi:hypothetical protein